jgi:Ca2+-transporting ATPase
MTVTEGWFGGVSLDHAPAAQELPKDLRAGLELNFALNSKAFLIEHGPDLVEFVGNRWESQSNLLLACPVSSGVQWRTHFQPWPALQPSCLPT